MEESIRRAEKLAHATNSALAQMKYNLTFEDLDKGPELRFEGKKMPDWKRRDISLEEELHRFEEDFRSEANEMLLKMDKMLDPNQFPAARKGSTQALKARGKMKEINKKIDHWKLEQSLNGVDQSRQKLLNLINHEPCKKTDSITRLCSSKESVIGKQIPVKDTQPREKELTPKKLDAAFSASEKPTITSKRKEELKNKLLETQEIVDRGFQTARQISQRFENLAKNEKKLEKTPSSGKTFFSEITNSKSLDQIQRSESNETFKTVNSGVCDKCHGVKEKKKKREREAEKERRREMVKVGDDKNGVVHIKRPESRRPKAPKLKLQRLPSLHIKGGLQMQKIYNLEIPRQDNENVPLKANTGFEILTHEQIEERKAQKMLQDIEKENCFCVGDKSQENCIECFNCGKLIRMQEQSVDPRDIDKLLLKCNFNVLDPRIDEFVEKCNQAGAIEKFHVREKAEEKVREEKECSKDEVREPIDREENKESEKKKTAEKTKHRSKGGHFKIQQLGEQLSKKYKEKACELENDHMEFENILRNLFKKVDESREFFDDCQFLPSFRKQNEFSRKIQRLSATKPVVVCLTSDDVASERTTTKTDEPIKALNDLTTFRLREKRKKLDKKDVKNKCKSRTQDLVAEDEIKRTGNIFRKKETNRKSEKRTNNKRSPEFLTPLPLIATKIFNELCEDGGNNKTEIAKNGGVKGSLLDRRFYESSSSSQGSIKDIKDRKEEDEMPKLSTSENERKTSENDYESDFEGESATTCKNDLEEAEEEQEEMGDEEELEVFKCFKKLSTISEVDSELERKLSEIDQIGQKAEGETVTKTLSTPKSDSSGNEARSGGVETPKSDKTNESVKQVGYNGFEKSRTMKHSREPLESTQSLKQSTLPENCVEIPSSSSGSSEISLRNQNSVSKRSKNVEDNKNFSPKSSKSLNTRTEEAKMHKSRSDASVSQRTSSTEMVASLKEVLSALKEQFARTQLLADKLTENVGVMKRENEVPKSESPKESRELGLNSRQMVEDSTFLSKEMVNTLQKVRKDLNLDNTPCLEHPKSPLSLLPRVNDWKSTWEAGVNQSQTMLGFMDQATPKGWTTGIGRKTELNGSRLSPRSISEEEGSPGEISSDSLKATSRSLAPELKRKGPEKSDTSSNSESGHVRLSSRKKASRVSSGRSNVERRNITSPLVLGSNNDVSYSEGEIPSNGLSDIDSQSIQSIGEVLQEQISGASSLE